MRIETIKADGLARLCYLIGDDKAGVWGSSTRAATCAK